MLRDYDCVEIVRTEPRRGALQHFYRATARPTLDALVRGQRGVGSPPQQLPPP
jgi:hypothetical protein